MVVHCPVCFAPVDHESIMVEPGVAVHGNIVCLTHWGSLQPAERHQRVKHAGMIGRGPWMDRPFGEGNYWARRRNCGVVVNIAVRRVRDHWTVACGPSNRPLAEFDEYQFLKKAA